MPRGLCAAGYGWIRRRDPLLMRLPFIANPHGLEEYRTQDMRKWLAYAPFRALYSYGTRARRSRDRHRCLHQG